MAPTTTRNKQPVICAALSGGVDSSVAAALLQERGFVVYGIHIKMWSDPDIPCNFKEDRYDAMAVAAALDIPFQTWDFTEEYRRTVVEYMVHEYAAGRTPNPDVMCNREIKFGLFLQKALAMGADYVATGHYVRLRCNDQNGESDEADEVARFHRAERFIERNDSSSQLLQAIDQNKDQSYFLWTLTHDKLRHCLFPIGEYTKPEVRALARRHRLPTAEKPDSQGICFIGEIDIREFLKKYIPERRGRVLTAAGRLVGEHSGVEFFTVGQRAGIGIGGGIPYYVARKDQAANDLVVAEGPYDAGLFRSELVATGVNWISGQAPRFPLRCEARIRYRQPLQPCRVTQIDADETPINADHLRESAYQSAQIRVEFDEPQRAVTPGQSVVFYQERPLDGARGKELLGGGVIA